MKRMIAVLAGLVTVSAASAHFVFIVPDDAASGKATLIFSDSLKPDEKVNIERLAPTKLFLFAPDAKDVELKWTADKAAACGKVDVPGSGTRVVFGTTDMGVLQRGDSKPFLLHYYPKAVIGAIPAAEKCALGKRVPIELVPILEGGKVRFQALVGSKSQSKVEVAVMIPGADKIENVMTDEKGLTPAFEKAGQYGVQFRSVEVKTGEDKGKKYEEVRQYATLVVSFDVSAR